MPNRTGPSSPVQSASKTLVLLRHIGTRHAEGVRLTDLVELTGFDKSTIHRLLGCLLDEGFVERIASTKLYRLGIEAMQLGFSAADMAPLVQRLRPVMLRIARITEDTVFLVVRSRDEAVYVDRQEGSYPVKAFVAEPGKRRLLGFSAVGICMLAQGPDEEIVSMHRRHAEAYEKQGMTLATLRSLVRFARKNGYSEMCDFGPADTAGVGYAFQMSASTKVGIGLAAIGSRMGVRRRRELGQVLQRELGSFAMAPSH
jgi:DNA-binding IclR family transcriptional regulator